MSKYTPDEIKAMANEVLRDKANGGERYLVLVLTMSMKTGLTPEECDLRIHELATTGATA